MESQLWMTWGSVLVSLFACLATTAKDFLPYTIRSFLMRRWRTVVEVFNPYVDIRIDELSGEWLRYSLAYGSIETYLANTSSTRARKLKGRMDKDSHNLILSMDEYEEVTDDFHGVTVWWTSGKSMNRSQSFSFYPSPDEKRFYKLSFHKRHRKLVVDSYMKHVVEEAKVIEARNRRRKLYTNNPKMDDHSYRTKLWSHVPFEHPATFETVAMDANKKNKIIKDLDFFKNSKEYYRRIGKAWKRGYLLYGPPGTGKSTMIAAMANYMDYDVYDLELTSVKDNTELRKLMIETSSKSIIVIEDIDCSLDLTGSRKKKEEEEEEEEKQEKKKGVGGRLSRGKDESRVTLSGLLNFIDGLWSACGGERLIIFTTNHIEKLDPALIRTGRMDRHIEMSYCCYEGFKVLAKNYLGLEWHELFKEVRRLFEVDQVQVAPADVAERLMAEALDEKEEENRTCLRNLIEFMEKAKEEKMKKETAGEGDRGKNTEEEDGASVSESDHKD
ncbi:AAA-ATPase At3g28580-like [Nymphaea colorata]|uniref:AAA+ ATPase domain-containing protein n=1 Tax=Nymphaea colorata TaxID=210225 RepID=A0A5K1E912_9MAGN|nr:AAA-ATPase At3g28580-like [Nymphaea colorata]